MRASYGTGRVSAGPVPKEDTLWRPSWATATVPLAVEFACTIRRRTSSLMIPSELQSVMHSEVSPTSHLPLSRVRGDDREIRPVLAPEECPPTRISGQRLWCQKLEVGTGRREERLRRCYSPRSLEMDFARGLSG